MTMQLLLMLLVALPVCSYCLAVPSDTAGLETFQGTIASVGMDSVVIVQSERKREFTVTRNSMILLELAEVKLSEIKPGYTAMVTAEKEGDKWVVKILDAKRKM